MASGFSFITRPHPRDLNAYGVSDPMWGGDTATVVVSRPARTLEATGEEGLWGVLRYTYRPKRTLSSSGVTALAAFAGTMVATRPARTLSASGGAIAFGTITASRALRSLESTGQAGEFQTNVFVMNMDTYAVSEYSNYPFNSFCGYGMDYYGADSNGIWKLQGDFDEGQAIEMEISKQRMNFGSYKLKRAREIFINMESSGDLSLEMFADQLSHAYALSNGASGLHVLHADPGKGLKGMHLGFIIRNAGGAHVLINSIEMLVDILSRRASND